ncbi:MAG TPA: extracellular solute-binding protein [Chloroflexota bacterium]|nr:extracellular solute-binding protein [Chloroflexota bacterium]
MTVRPNKSRRDTIRLLLSGGATVLLAACGASVTGQAPSSSATGTSTPDNAATTTNSAVSTKVTGSTSTSAAATAAGAAAVASTSTSASSFVSIAGRATVQFWSRFPWLADVARLYNAGPGDQNKVALQYTNPGDMVTKLTTALAGGTPPDLVTLDVVQCPRFTVAGGFADITSAYNQLSYKSELVPAMLNQGQAAGKQYLIPFESDTSALLWNKALLQEAGLDAEKGPQTWGDFRTYAQKLTHPPGRYGTWLVINGGGSYTFTFMPWAWMNGGDLLNTDGTKCILNSPQTAEALDLWANMNVKDRSTPDENRAGKAFDTQKTFVAGNLGLLLGGNANVVSLAKGAPTLDFATGLFPPKDAGGTSASEAGGDNTGIPTGTKTRDQAWQVIQYLLSAPVQVEFLAKLGSIPVRSSMGDNAYFKANPRMAVFAKTLAVARTPYTPKFNELFKTADSPLIVRLDEAVRGLRSVSEALSLAEQEINGLLGK